MNIYTTTISEKERERERERKDKNKRKEKKKKNRPQSFTAYSLDVQYIKTFYNQKYEKL